MNKHKKFIKECYEGKHGTMCQEWKERILEHYPEFNEEKFKEGDWVYNHLNLLVRVGDVEDFGFRSECGEYWSYYTNTRKATPKEIVSHLEAEILRLM